MDLGPTSRDWLAEIARYKVSVKSLTVRNRTLELRLGKTIEAHRSEIKVLKAQLREGLTPELIALKRKLSDCQERLRAAESKLAEVKRGAHAR